MSKSILKAVALVLLLALSLSLISCERDREYDAAEVEAAARVLIEKSNLINEIFYGEGIPTAENQLGSTKTYLEADSLWLALNGFETIEELKKMTTDVYTSGYSENIFAATLQSIMGSNDQLARFARYIQIYEGEEGSTPVRIEVNVKWELRYHDKVEYLLDTVSVSGVKGQKVYVTLDANVTNDNGDTQKRTITVGLIEEENGWRLDEPTYLKYS